jgi:hypothetical protein
VYPNNGQSVPELMEVGTDVVEVIVVVVVNVDAGEADFPPPQAVVASAIEPISTARLAKLIGHRNGITIQATSASGCQPGTSGSPRSSIE